MYLFIMLKHSHCIKFVPAFIFYPDAVNLISPSSVLSGRFEVFVKAFLMFFATISAIDILPCVCYEV
jgi:hypothetical protein